MLPLYDTWKCLHLLVCAHKDDKAEATFHTGKKHLRRNVKETMRCSRSGWNAVTGVASSPFHLRRDIFVHQKIVNFKVWFKPVKQIAYIVTLYLCSSLPTIFKWKCKKKKMVNADS